eukprot:TRINITY_DN66852_c1_g2_i1.p1 TRINITY_DN66852_c1_g2~~TRINITY_DN66852_c1_g2_i1.p1  ORF type:complete len:180 (+),score=92.02 TRINITY_DN66852_c1_g2_i1:493-1032(+)
MYTDCVTIVLVSLASAFVSEGISWFLVYRKPEYQSLKKTIDTMSKKLEKKKEEVITVARQKTRDKKIAQMDEQLKVKNRDMSMLRFKATFVVMITLIGVFAMLSSTFDGRPVAKLPFTPFSIIRRLSHRNLPGSDYTDCSMMFLYALCSFAIKQNVAKFFGFAPAKGAPSLFAPPPDTK